MKLLQALVVIKFVVLSSSAVRAEDPPKNPKGQIHGQFDFGSRKPGFDGIDAGQPDDTRKYIAGHPESSQRAIWQFKTLPKGIAEAPNDVVPIKLACTKFALTKEAHEQPTEITIRVVSHSCPQGPPTEEKKGEWLWVGKDVKDRKEKYDAEVAAYRAKKIDPAKADAEGWKAANSLAEKYGYFEVRVTHFPELVETKIDLPAGLLRNALKNEPETGDDGKTTRPIITIYLKCEVPALLLGVKESDLYVVEPSPPKK